jgi:hypothetical protein
MLAQHYGSNFLPKLGAQKPQIYASTLPQQQALASGEIAPSALVGAQLLDLKAQGAPVDFVIPKGGAWNAPKIPDTFYVQPRRQKLADLTPAKVTAFQANWNSLFH